VRTARDPRPARRPDRDRHRPDPRRIPATAGGSAQVRAGRAATDAALRRVGDDLDAADQWCGHGRGGPPPAGWHLAVGAGPAQPTGPPPVTESGADRLIQSPTPPDDHAPWS